LKARWEILNRLLKTLNRLNDYLIIEYGWGGFTSKLSRLQLAKIALALPPRDQWKSQNFEQIKGQLRLEYSLSSNDFSKALKVIQTRRELASLLGYVIPIPDFGAADLIRFFDIWRQNHNLEELLNLK
jgi:hypothetical protein